MIRGDGQGLPPASPRRPPALVGRVPIRLRLTMIFAVAMLFVLALSGVVIFERVRSQVDARLNLDVSEQAQSLLARAQDSPAGLVKAVTMPSQAGRAAVAQVLDRHGRVLAATPDARKVSLLSGERLRAALRHRLRFNRRTHLVPRRDDDGLRLASTPIQIPGHGSGVLVVGMSLDQRTASLNSLTLTLLIVGPIALLIVILVGYRLTAAALRPVELMRARAAVVSATEPGLRLPLPPANDEIRHLGLTLNQMLERLEESFARERSFVANASHELRTPLATMRAELDLALRRPRSGAELLEALRSAQVEAERLSALTEDLLLLARAGGDGWPIAAKRFDLLDLVQRVIARFESGERPIRFRGPPQQTVVADPERIEQALTNLIDNALRYGEGEVVVCVRGHEPERVELHVLDQGPGFPPQFVDHAFERFSRAPPGRSGPGTGLGLSIVQEIARAHGGEAHIGGGPEGADVWLVIPGSRDA